jgi:predicted PurR-regulated permease PerM
MPNGNRRTEPRQIYSSIFLAAGLFVAISVFPSISPILLSLILTLLVALAINPLILKLRRWSGGRTVATGLVLIAFLGIAGLTALAFYKPMKRSTAKFIQQLPEYWERIQRPIMKMEQKAVMSEQRLKREVSTEVANENGAQTNAPAPPVPEPENQEVAKPPSGNFVRSGLGAILGGVTGSFKSIAADAASIALVIITTFFSAIFMLLKPRPVISMIFATVPEQHHTRARNILHRIVDFVPRWALATLTGMTIIGVLIFLAMWPLFGFQDALVLGLIALVFEAVPYIGPILASVPALLLAVGDGGMKPLWVLIAYCIIQAIENNLIMPLVIGGQLRLHPVAVIFSMLLCVATFGVLGVLLAMPMVAIILIFHEEIYRPRFLPNITDEDLDRIAQATLERKKVLCDIKDAPEKKPDES